MMMWKSALLSQPLVCGAALETWSSSVAAVAPARGVAPRAEEPQSPQTQNLMNDIDNHQQSRI